MDQFQEFIVTSNYCRWLESEGRRETWRECVDRYFDYFLNRFDELQNYEDDWNDIREMVYNRKSSLLCGL